MWTYAGARALDIDLAALADYVSANPTPYARRVLKDLAEMYALRPWTGITAQPLP